MEDNMSVLKTLTYTMAPKSSVASPEQYRRDKLVANLREQLAIVQARLAGKSHVVLRKRWQLASDGSRVPVDAEKRLKQWWTETDGGVLLMVKWANKPIEFEKGKSAIAVANMEKLPETLQQLILAAANGEFDNLIATTKRQRKLPVAAS